MKQGKTINELAAEITRQQENKRDFLIKPSKMRAYEHEGKVEVGFAVQDGNKVEELFTGGLTDNGHQQLGSYLNIPKKYYDLMKGHPHLLATNIQHWLERSSDRRMVRTLDGNIRALLSDKYRRLDNYDLAQHILPILNDAQISIESCEVTEKKLYIKAVNKNITSEIKVGDLVSAGVLITNSEIGSGSLSVKPLVFRLVCSNGMVVDKLAMRKYHAGRQNEMEQIEFKNDTLNAEDKAFWLKVRDLVKHSINEATFESIVDEMRVSTEKRIAAPEDAIELVSKSIGLQVDEQSNVLKHLIEGGDLTNWGMANAVTRMAQDVDSYDRSTDLEAFGYAVMNMNFN